MPIGLYSVTTNAIVGYPMSQLLRLSVLWWPVILDRRVLIFCIEWTEKVGDQFAGELPYY